MGPGGRGQGLGAGGLLGMMPGSRQEGAERARPEQGASPRPLPDSSGTPGEDPRTVSLKGTSQVAEGSLRANQAPLHLRAVPVAMASITQ